MRIPVVSERLLDVFTAEERVGFDVRPVENTPATRTRFFEFVPRRFVPEVAGKSFQPDGWRCGLCGRRYVSNAGVLGYGYNSELLARKKLPEPKCWSDLLSEKYKDDVQVADPNSSGTSYTMLATIVQIYGEDKGFDYLKKLHKNINQYTKSGAAPAKAAASGETLIGITFLHDLVTMAVGGAPLKTVAPCEGTGYEVGSMSIIKGGRNQKEARAWYDWALTPEAQSIGAEARAFQMPSNKNAKVPPQAPRLEQIKVIDYDFAKYGSSAERKRLLSKWDKEVKALPK
jgi:iron(III) transport system substrate-binding protein